MINVPKVHQMMNAVNLYLRNDSSLPKKVQELAMLVTARELDCQYIWNAHAMSARAASASSVASDGSAASHSIKVGLRPCRRTACA